VVGAIELADGGGTFRAVYTLIMAAWFGFSGLRLLRWTGPTPPPR
jgi:hypothetical protein